jgi:hypothetical protein
MSVGALLWSSLRELVVAVGRRLIGWLLRGFAARWARRRITFLKRKWNAIAGTRRATPWRLRWLRARIELWRRVVDWVEDRGQQLERETLCECSKIAKREGIPMDSPDETEPKRAPRKAA